MGEEELTQSDEQLLAELSAGAKTKGALVDATDLSRNTVYNRLELLEANGIIECIHEPTRLFELCYDPRGQEQGVKVLGEVWSHPGRISGNLVCPGCGESLCHIGFNGTPTAFEAECSECGSPLFSGSTLLISGLDNDEYPSTEERQEIVTDYWEMMLEEEAERAELFAGQYELYADNFGWDWSAPVLEECDVCNEQMTANELNGATWIDESGGAFVQVCTDCTNEMAKRKGKSGCSICGREREQRRSEGLLIHGDADIDIDAVCDECRREVVFDNQPETDPVWM